MWCGVGDADGGTKPRSVVYCPEKGVVLFYQCYCQWRTDDCRLSNRPHTSKSKVVGRVIKRFCFGSVGVPVVRHSKSIGITRFDVFFCANRVLEGVLEARAEVVRTSFKRKFQNVSKIKD